MAIYNIQILSNNGIKLYPNDENPQDYTLQEIDVITSKMKDKSAFYYDYINQDRKDLNVIVNDIQLVRVESDLEKSPYKIIYPIAYDNAKLHSIAQKVLEIGKSTISYDLIADYLNELLEELQNENAMENFKQDQYISKKLKKALTDYIDIENKTIISDYEARQQPILMKEIKNYICSYSVLRNVLIWHAKFNKELDEEYIKKLNYYEQLVQSEFPEVINSEISNRLLKELYDKYDGDIEKIVEVVGTDFMDNLSDEDQQLSGYYDYNKRGR